MKLYTEEQIRSAYIDGYYDCKIGEDSHHYSYQCPNSIELPSDEDIELRTSYFKFEKNKQVFYNGAKWAIQWVIEQIKQ